jgi:hypothetical protein
MHRQYGAMTALQREAGSGSPEAQQSLEMQDAIKKLEVALAETSKRTDKPGGDLSVNPPTLQTALADLETLEQALSTEIRYVYGPDWDIAPGKLTSKKGTWIKPSTCFSWEIP